MKQIIVHSKMNLLYQIYQKVNARPNF